VRVADSAAVLQIESGGRGFASDGRMMIRFENHVFYDQWGQANPGRFNQHFKFDPVRRWTGHQFRKSATGAWQSQHSGQGNEHEVLEFARGLDDSAALQSISMGIAQIMGFHYRSQGFSSPREMFDTFSGAIRPQLDGMFTFIENKRICIEGLREGDYTKFATGYNGAGKAAQYGAAIRDAARAFEQVAGGRNFS
jgi:hypothetical protein